MIAHLTSYTLQGLHSTLTRFKINKKVLSSSQNLIIIHLLDNNSHYITISTCLSTFIIAYFIYL